MRILRNSIICKKCEEEIVSKHVHDYVECKCGSVMVDGGNQYLRRSADGYICTSVIDDGTHELRRQYLLWGNNYDKDMNRLPKTIWKPIAELDTDHIQAILDGKWCKSEYYLQVFNDELKYRKEV
jgi:hypothetical protein